MAKLPKAKCPACGASFELDHDSNEGDIISCPECFAELEIMRTDPPVVAETDIADEGAEGEGGYGDGEGYNEEDEDPYSKM